MYADMLFPCMSLPLVPLGSRELELQTVVHCYVSAGNQTPVFVTAEPSLQTLSVSVFQEGELTGLLCTSRGSLSHRRACQPRDQLSRNVKNCISFFSSSRNESSAEMNRIQELPFHTLHSEHMKLTSVA